MENEDYGYETFRGLAIRSVGYTGDSRRFVVDEELILKDFSDGVSGLHSVMWRSPLFQINRYARPILKPANELEQDLLNRLSVRITETNLRQVRGWVEVEVRINDEGKPYLPYLTLIDCLETNAVIIGRDFEQDIEFINSHNDQIRFTVDPENRRYAFDEERNVLIDKRYRRVIWGFNNSTIPSDVISIGSKAFEGCKKLSNMVIPDCICEICDNAFLKCEALTSVTIPATVRRIAHPFEGCRNLSQVTFEGNTWVMGRTFGRDTQLLSSTGEKLKVKDFGIFDNPNYGQLILGKGDEEPEELFF